MDTESRRRTSVNPDATPLNTSAAAERRRVTAVNPDATPLDGAGALDAAQEAERSRQLRGEMEKLIGEVVDGFKLVSLMSVSSGEGAIFSCTNDTGNQYCFKLYLRDTRISEEVHRILENMEEPYVARLIHWGYRDGRMYEVWPLYSKGSIFGKKFDEQSIRKVIGQMNHALNGVHKNGIVHQDVKPQNFMLDDNDDIVLIDFGTGSVMGPSDGRSYVSVVGGTKDYSAPEALLDGDCWPISDYYSMGVSIYELLFGRTPYANYDEKTRSRKFEDMHANKIPDIEKCSEDMRHLLWGLLWYDRHERWGFQQVLDWLRNDYDRWRLEPAADDGVALTFKNVRYIIPGQLPQLVKKMAEDWDEGLARMNSEGSFFDYAKRVAGKDGLDDLYVAFNSPKPAGESSLNTYFKKLYLIYPDLKEFVWKGWACADRKVLGDAILETLWQEDANRLLDVQSASTTISEVEPPPYDIVLYWFKNHIISQYLRFTNAADADAISELEDSAQTSPLARYRLAYKLSGSTRLRLLSGEFQDKAALLRYVEEKAREGAESGSMDSFLQFCRNEIYDGAGINPGFQAWIEGLGYETALGVLTGEIAPQPIRTTKSGADQAADTSSKSGKLDSTGGSASEESAISGRVHIACPKCGGRISLSKTDEGSVVKCPYCGADVRIE